MGSSWLAGKTWRDGQGRRVGSGHRRQDRSRPDGRQGPLRAMFPETRATHDFDVLSADGRVIAVEVTRHAAEEQVQRDAEIARRSWRFSNLRHRWHVGPPGTVALGANRTPTVPLAPAGWKQGDTDHYFTSLRGLLDVSSAEPAVQRCRNATVVLDATSPRPSCSVAAGRYRRRFRDAGAPQGDEGRGRLTEA